MLTHYWRNHGHYAECALECLRKYLFFSLQPPDSSTISQIAGIAGVGKRLWLLPGTYKLEVTEITGDSDDYTADLATTGRVAVGGSATGDIEPPGDRDWFAVDLEAGKTYRFDLEGPRTGGGTLTDPYLYGIYGEDGDWINGTANDDGGQHYNSRVYFTPDEGATYYVSAGAHGDPTGTYTLSVEDVDAM